MVFEKKKELREPEILKKIFELRNAGSGFNNIASAISEEFNVNLTHPTAKNLYYEYAAKQKIKAATGEEVKPGDDWDKMLKAKFERIERITSTLLDAVETIKKKLTPEDYLRYAPTIIAILRESLSQLAFIRNEQEQIVIKQENMIYSPIQIMAQMNQIEEKKKQKEYVIVGEQQVERDAFDEEVNDEETTDDLDKEEKEK